MQFPQPIVKSLVLYDNNGNAVIVLGPGPTMTITDPVSGTVMTITDDSSKSAPVIRVTNPASGLSPSGSTIESALYSNYDSGTKLLSSTLRSGFYNNPAGKEVQTALTLAPPLDVITLGFYSTSGVTPYGANLALDESNGAVLSFFDTTSGAQNNFLGVRNADIIVKKPIVNTESWNTLAGSNGWTPNVSLPLSYRKDPTGRVWFRGIIASGTLTGGTLIFTLPVGYRPTQEVNLTVAADAAPNNIMKIATNGQCLVFNAVAGNYYWDIASFPTV